MGFETRTLVGGGQVTLASWEDQSPPTHGVDMRNKPWNAGMPRDGLAFYESTVQYMRNDWAQANMSPTMVRVEQPVSTDHGFGMTVDSVEHKDLLLFHSKATDTWHTAEALDIDHAAEWKKHLVAKGVTNQADAQMAYNDVDNLRLLPSVHNRSRDKLDGLIEDHGLDSTQFRKWRKENIDFDPGTTHRAFDPDSDAVVRRASTRDTEWTVDDGRKGLAFDTRVKNIWMENALSKLYVGSVPIHDDGTGKDYSVPLFRCPATQQLVTRDAFDIDHKHPFSEVLKDLCDQSIDGKITKAEALDAYNDVDNLRLVNRSANSSHEWELGARGEYDSDIDFGADDTRGMFDDTPQPLRMNEPDHPNYAMYKKALSEMETIAPDTSGITHLERENAASSLVQSAVAHGMDRIDEVVFNPKNQELLAVMGDPPRNGAYAALSMSDAIDRTLEQNSDVIAVMPKPHGPMLQQALQEMRENQRFVMGQALDLRDKGILDFEYPTPTGQAKPAMMSNPAHPDHADFKTVRDWIDRVDPERRTLPQDGYRDNLAAAVVLDARKSGLTHIDGVMMNQDKTGVIALQGNLQNPSDPTNQMAATNVSRGALTPVDYSTHAMDQARQLAAQQATMQVQPTTQQQTTSAMIH